MGVSRKKGPTMSVTPLKKPKLSRCVAESLADSVHFDEHSVFMYMYVYVCPVTQLVDDRRRPKPKPKTRFRLLQRNPVGRRSNKKSPRYTPRCATLCSPVPAL
jgi:hypothetical protein